MPLMPDDESNFRLSLGDIGMFSYQSGINATSFVSNERGNTLSGIFFENYVAGKLIAKGTFPDRTVKWIRQMAAEKNHLICV